MFEADVATFAVGNQAAATALAHPSTVLEQAAEESNRLLGRLRLTRESARAFGNIGQELCCLERISLLLHKLIVEGRQASLLRLLFQATGR